MEFLCFGIIHPLYEEHISTKIIHYLWILKLYAVEQLFLSVLNEHAPIKQTMIRGNQVPYMTEQWRGAIRHRNKLWKNSRAIVLMQITRHTKLNVIPAPLLGRKQ